MIPQDRYYRIKSEIQDLHMNHQFVEKFEKFAELYLQLVKLENEEKPGKLKSTMEFDIVQYGGMFYNLYDQGSRTFNQLGELPRDQQLEKVRDLEQLSKGLMTFGPENPGFQELHKYTFYHRRIIDSTLEMGDPILN